VIKEIDLNNDGKIDFEEFMAMMKNSDEKDSPIRIHT